MNKARLEVLADVTLANAKSFNMMSYIDGPEGFENRPKPYFDKVEGKAMLIGECGTTCCFAGLAALLFAPDDVTIGVENLNIEEIAQRELGLTNDQADELFLTAIGPDRDADWEEDRDNFATAEEYAKAGYDRIHSFIKENDFSEKVDKDWNV